MLTTLLFITLCIQFIVGLFAINAATSRGDKEVPWVLAFVIIFIVSMSVGATLAFTTDSAPQTIHSCRCEK